MQLGQSIVTDVQLHLVQLHDVPSGVTCDRPIGRQAKLQLQAPRSELAARLIDELKNEFRRNCQNWSQDKKRKAKRKNARPTKPEIFRKMLAVSV